MEGSGEDGGAQEDLVRGTWRQIFLLGPTKTLVASSVKSGATEGFWTALAKTDNHRGAQRKPCRELVAVFGKNKFVYHNAFTKENRQ